MRHKKSGRHLNRNSSHRSAMFRNMIVSLFQKESIKTTLIKAKELRRFAEPLLTLAKKDTLANRRLAFDRLQNRDIVNKLFTDLGKRFQDRPGGYLRILKCDFRVGDSAPLAYVELIGQAEKKALALKARTEKVKETKKKKVTAKAPKEREEI